MQGHLDGLVGYASDFDSLRSWSHGMWVWALCQALCWQCGAWSLLWILSASALLPISVSLSLSLSLSTINIIFFLNVEYVGAPVWASDAWFQLRSWSHTSDQTLHWTLCWAWSLLKILSLPPLFPSHPLLSLSLSLKTNKQTNKQKECRIYVE